MNGEHSFLNLLKTELPCYQELENIVANLKDILKHQDNLLLDFELKIDDLERLLQSDQFLSVRPSSSELAKQLGIIYSPVKDRKNGCTHYKRPMLKLIRELEINQPSCGGIEDIKQRALKLFDSLSESGKLDKCDELKRDIFKILKNSEYKFRLSEVRRLAGDLDRIPISSEISVADRDAIRNELKKLFEIINKDEVIKCLADPSRKTLRMTENLDVTKLQQRREQLLKVQSTLLRANKDSDRDGEKLDDKFFPGSSSEQDDADIDKLAQEHVIVELLGASTTCQDDERARGGIISALSLFNLQNNADTILPLQSFAERNSEEVMSAIKKLLKTMLRKLRYLLKKLEFSGCEVAVKHLEELLRGIQQAEKVIITKFSIDYNSGSITEMIPLCCKIINMCNTTKVSLVYNDLRHHDIKNLSEYLAKNTKIEELDISYNKNIGKNGYYVLGRFLIDHHVKVLIASDCNISDDELKNFFSGMKDAKRDKFEEYGEHSISRVKTEMERNTKFVPEQKMRDSKMADSGLSDEDLKNLQESGISERMLELDISWSRNLTAVGFEHLGEFVGNKNVRRLRLSGFQLTPEKLQAFCSKLQRNPAIKYGEDEEVLIEELDVSYNSTLEPESYKILGTLVKICGVKKLSLAGCGISEEHLRKLRESTKNYEMKSLSAADNSSIGEGILEIAKIVRESNLEELDISDCNLATQEIKEFRIELDDAKLKRLTLGDQSHELGSEFIYEVCELLANIEEQLILKCRILRESYKESLESACEAAGIELSVKDQDKNEDGCSSD